MLRGSPFEKIDNNSDLSSPEIEYFYNDRGQKLKKVDHIAHTETWYIRDLSGNLISRYERSSALALPLELKEVPVYGNSRMGIYHANAGRFEYEIKDHLGNVRLTITENSSHNGVQVLTVTDYYPGGSPMPGRKFVGGTGEYRYSYQGQEKEALTGQISFELREYDASLLRFNNPDPYGQFISPYLAMGNNPISMIDPDGGWTLMDEYDVFVMEDGSERKTKVSDLGGDDVDFMHYTFGENDGQTEIKSNGTGESVFMSSLKNISGYNKRGNGTTWNTIYEEFLKGEGPTNSLITNDGMLQDLMKSPQFAEVFGEYIDAGAPDKMAIQGSFGVTGAIEAGGNMTSQMIGKANYSFYNVGDKLVITVMDSRSVQSY